MGNLQDREKNEKINDVKKIYWDADGNLRHGASENSRDEELMDILQADREDDRETALWLIMPSRWIRKWLLFAHFKVCDAPGRIDMFSLLQQDDSIEGGWRPKKTLNAPLYNDDPDSQDHPGHYRRVSLEAWLRFVDHYGVSGYAIAVLGAPADDKSRWRVFKNPRVIDVSRLPPPVIAKVEEEKADEKPKKSGKLGMFGL